MPANPLATIPLSHATFLFGPAGTNDFPTLYGSDGSAPLVDAAILTVMTEWTGCFDKDLIAPTGVTDGPASGFWQNLPTDLRQQKQLTLMNYLVAWWVADMRADAAEGALANAMPLASKSIGGVSVSFRDLGSQDAMRQLESNAYGIKAKKMIEGSPERLLLLLGGGPSGGGPWPPPNPPYAGGGIW